MLYRGCTAICIGNYTIDITSDNNTTATTSTNNNSNQSAAGNVWWVAESHENTVASGLWGDNGR